MSTASSNGAGIFQRIQQARKAWQQARTFLNLSPDECPIVFYAESASSWVHFESMIEELTGPMQRKICYLTSDPNDPVLERKNSQMRSFYIGEGSARTWVFLNLQARVMVMTMPELETFQIKRSQTHPVHYVYVFHSMVSTHMIYRPNAFDHFDTIFCVGPHHVQEIRAAEAAQQLKPKRLIPHGFARLESLMQQRQQCVRDLSKTPQARRILIAPSWGAHALLETCGKELVTVLLQAGYPVTVRPHPMTQKENPALLRALQHLLNSFPSSVLETNVASQDSLQASDMLISDWSGAALEYAFAMERPVLFIDVPKKIRNPNYGKIAHPPIEVTIRDQIGSVVDPKNLREVPQQIQALTAAADPFRTRIQALRNQIVFNVGISGRVGAREIARLV